MEAGDHGWSWIMCIKAQFRLKTKVIADVVPPIDLDIYSENINLLKSTYKQKLKLYKNMRNISKTQLKQSKHVLMKIYQLILDQMES